MSRFPERYKFPLLAEQLSDLEQAVREFVLPGYCPSAPFVSRSMITLTAGSCFAQEIADALNRQGLFARFWSNDTDNYMSPVVTQQMLELNQDSVLKKVLAKSSLIVLTIGQAMTGFVAGKPIATITRSAVADVDWRLLTPDETGAAIRGIVHIIRATNPRCHIALTLSPIPLKLSLGNPSVFGQDCLSKSILRVGIEQALSETNVSYWPSFEIVRWLGAHIGPFFGEGDNRHPHKDVVDLITRIFIEKYFLPNT